ncbi:ABC transporter substrate-binding protein [Chishuiella sp.]|uniref:ABC transporter substrate-binding protein n=1 Tax=Chishuiella sp. TaxID=1969467 RepID=UPI0028AC6CD9|nr:ABC transporter substrate-binding protein [Chishuiella sp.]
MIKQILYLFICISLLNSCKKENNEKKVIQNDVFHFAKNISINESEKIISISTNGNELSFNKKDLPIRNVMVETSSAVTYLDKLGLLKFIKGVTDANFIYNPKIQQAINNKSILEIGNSNELNIELILKNKPQLIIANSNPVLAKYHQQLEQNGIKILYLDEYKEQNPIGQVEYLKVFGKLFNQNERANIIVDLITERYDSIKNIIQINRKGNVSTLVNTMYGDVWYLPSKDLLQAKLINDAKGNYIFNDYQGTNSFSLTFEEVYKKAKNAVYWINVSNVNSLSEMKATNTNYTWFDAYQKGNVYAYNKRINAKGSNDYFEQGIIRPDIVLNDLGKIFYPELFPNYTLYFYQQLK